MKQLLNLSSVIELLEKGGVVAFPTETSYGLLGNAYNTDTIDTIYKIKGREKNSPLSLLVKDQKMAEELCVLDKRTKKVFNKFLPGPLTLILPAKKKIPGVTHQNSIALRVSSDKKIQQIFNNIAFPLSATSANLSGKNDLYSDTEIVRTYSNRDIVPDAVYMGGKLKKKNPSTIVNLSTNEVTLVRKGDILISDIKQAIEK